MPLFTLGLGFLLIYPATNKIDKGNAVIRARMILVVDSAMLFSVK
jgi:hypothetical protein